MSTVDDLVEWLRAQLDVIERAASDPNWRKRPHGPGCAIDADHAPECDCDYAGRVLCDIDAKRKILNLTRFDAQFPDSEGGYDSACEDVIKLLGAALSDRPGYQESWRP